MTRPHPLTDKTCEEICRNCDPFKSLNEIWFDSMRSATDWQLEQVLKFMEEDGFGPRRISLIKNAMRPQEDTND